MLRHIEKLRVSQEAREEQMSDQGGYYSFHLHSGKRTGLTIFGRGANLKSAGRNSVVGLA